MGRVDGKVAIVTGAAMGLGAASAEALAREGAKVLCTDVNVEEGEKTVDAIQNAGGHAAFAQHDVTDEAAWERVVAMAVDNFGPLNILVNNAGIAPSGAKIEELELDAWRHTIAVDLDSVFLGCKHGIRAMKGVGGSIINISSIMGMVGMSSGADYNAAKGGVRLLTKSAAIECAEAGYGIRVNSVHPGFIRTPLVQNAAETVIAGDSGASVNEVYDMLTLLHPIGRLGVPMEIGNAVLFLASEESSFMTGSEVVVDGGYTAR